jgi:hypothetical protein
VVEDINGTAREGVLHGRHEASLATCPVDGAAPVRSAGWPGHVPATHPSAPPP